MAPCVLPEAPPRFVQKALLEDAGDTVEYNLHVQVLSERYPFATGKNPHDN